LSEAAVRPPRHQRHRREVRRQPVAFGSRQRRQRTHVAGRVVEDRRIDEHAEQPIDRRRLEPELPRRPPQCVGVVSAVERGDELRSLRCDASDNNRTRMMDADLQRGCVAPHASQGGLHNRPHGHLLWCAAHGARCTGTTPRSVSSKGEVATRRPQSEPARSPAVCMNARHC